MPTMKIILHITAFNLKQIQEISCPFRIYEKRSKNKKKGQVVDPLTLVRMMLFVSRTMNEEKFKIVRFPVCINAHVIGLVFRLQNKLLDFSF